MFKVGQKVVCVVTSQDGGIKKGEIYQIEEIFEPVVIEYGVKVFGVWSWHPTGAYKASRFRPLDYAHTERIISEIIEKVKEEQLVSQHQ